MFVDLGSEGRGTLEVRETVLTGALIDLSSL